MGSHWPVAIVGGQIAFYIIDTFTRQGAIISPSLLHLAVHFSVAQRQFIWHLYVVSFCLPRLTLCGKRIDLCQSDGSKAISLLIYG